MDMSMFTSFEGRINRQKWWWGTIGLFVVNVILYFVLSALIGGSRMANMDPAAIADFIASAMRSAAIVQLIMVVIIAYPGTALMKKRLNDRDRPSWMVYMYWTPLVISILLNLTGMGMTATDVGGVVIPMSSTLSLIVSLASLVIGIWGLIELGFLRGTSGPNQHGPDPLAA